MKKLFLGITEFAVPSPLVGSIETYSGYGRLPEVGNQIHQDVQMARGREFVCYEAEKWISHEFDFEDYTISVSGRIDGFCDEPTLWIEEIKSAYDVDKLREKLMGNHDHPYRRQLLTYGYLHWLDTGEQAHLRFCLVNSRDRSEEFMDIVLDIKQYKEWLDRRLADIVAREKLFESARKRRKKSADLVFPFEVQRPGQHELLTSIDERLKNGSRMLIQAPTGLGKTMGVTYPALKNSLSRGQKLLYLTAKNSQHSVAEDAVERIQNAGGAVRALSLLSKRKMCFKEEVMCDPAYCEFAKDHYTKIEENKLHDKLLKKKTLNEKSIKEMAEKYEVCPFDLQMESAAFADVIIGDYNYVFSPNHVRDRLSKNSLGKSTSAPNLVVDEAHNLANRATDYFSAEISLSTFDQLLREIYDLSPEIQEGARQLVRSAEDFFAQVKEKFPLVNKKSVVQIKKEDTDDLREKAQKLLGVYLESDEPLRQDDPVLNIYNQVVTFSEIFEFQRDEFCIIYEEPVRNEGVIKIICCDAAWWLTECYQDFANVISFSATLKPFEYYRQLLGFTKEEVHCSEFSSPFPKENRKVLIVPQVSTKLRDREDNVPKIRDGIEKIVAVHKGNYFVFFPSFDFLERVALGFKVEGFNMLQQKRNMDRFEIETILTTLKENAHPTLVFAVQGGVFSEGVDYPGDILIGAIIVGPALPAFNFEREQIRNYFDKKFGDGFNYAYTFPAMTRTIQSAGRVIRSATDKGLIVLMDRRFLEKTYVASMPQDWVEDDAQKLASKTILKDLEEFWKERDVES